MVADLGTLVSSTSAQTKAKGGNMLWIKLPSEGLIRVYKKTFTTVILYFY